MAGQMTYTDPFMGVQNCSYICPGFPRACNHYCPGYSPLGIDLLTTPRETKSLIEKTMRSTYVLSHGNETTKLTETTAGTLTTLSQGPEVSPTYVLSHGNKTTQLTETTAGTLSTLSQGPEVSPTYVLSHGNKTTQLTETTAGTLSTLSQGPEVSPLIQAIIYIIGAAAVTLLILLVIWCLRDRIERSFGMLRQWLCEQTLQRPTQEINQDLALNQIEPEVQNLLHNSTLPKPIYERLNVARLTEASAPPHDIVDESIGKTYFF